MWLLSQAHSSKAVKRQGIGGVKCLMPEEKAIAHLALLGDLLSFTRGPALSAAALQVCCPITPQVHMSRNLQTRQSQYGEGPLFPKDNTKSIQQLTILRAGVRPSEFAVNPGHRLSARSNSTRCRQGTSPRIELLQCLLKFCCLSLNFPVLKSATFRPGQWQPSRPRQALTLLYSSAIFPWRQQMVAAEAHSQRFSAAGAL